ncbi:MAG: sigma-70 family RNA polymerase sigma factor, partial [Myxococcota bacterium]
RNSTMTSDGDLVTRARADDELAFAALVERYKGRVIGYLTRLTGCSARAEDLGQDTFIRFYERLERYEEQGKLGSYLLRLATRVFLSEERRLKRRALLSALLTVDDQTSEASMIENAYQRQVRDALRFVPPNFRAPLILYVVEGLSYGEIAEALGVRPGTVKSRIARARMMLKQRLSPPAQEEYDARLVAR